jgi:2-C-methyl-D-erythritol 4-phosphate cytidylyltransferase
MQQYAIIVAGGTGSRMNNAMPKQFLPINDKPIFYYSILAFINTFPTIELVLVVHKDFIKNMHSVLQHFAERINVTIVEGGETRFESVKNGLATLPNNKEAIVYIHDAARPFITKKLLTQLQSDCIEYGNAIPCIVANESMRMVSENTSSIIDRNKLRIIQTPQVFRLPILKKAFLQSYQDSFTDDASVCEADGVTIYLSNGIDENIKITTPTHLEMAEWTMKNWRI